MITSTDQLNRRISLPAYPRRIISVVPSQTELLYSLGLDNEVIAITKFCVHPDKWFRSKERIGGTKKLNLEKIRTLKPDLIIANREENTKEDIETLSRDYPVWISDIKTFEDALAMISSIGRLVQRETEASQLCKEIVENFAVLNQVSGTPINSIYLIWKNPYMAAGGDTFISQIMEKSGFINVLKDEKRYPEVTLEMIRKYNPKVVLLSSEPFPFKQKEADEISKLLEKSLVLTVDGEMFSWYGSRLLKSPSYLSELKRKITGNMRGISV